VIFFNRITSAATAAVRDAACGNVNGHRRDVIENGLVLIGLASNDSVRLSLSAGDLHWEEALRSLHTLPLIDLPMCL